jgi:hypothetical protein
VRQYLGSAKLTGDLVLCGCILQSVLRRVQMTTGVPFSSTHLTIDLSTVEQMAAQRALPLVPQQPRDNQGQFLSHKDVPGIKQPDVRQDQDPK